MKGKLRIQAAVSVFFACITRGMGFLLRLILSRAMGAEALGLMEMAGGVHHLLSAPAAGGYPGAVSRLTALETEKSRGNALYTGLRLSLKRGLALSILLLAAAPACAFLMGDLRTLPALWAYVPALPLISVFCVMDGYQYGIGRAFFPAAAECTEQLTRLLGLIACLPFLSLLPLPAQAAVPVLLGVAGEVTGGIIMLSVTRGRWKKPANHVMLTKKMESLSRPLMANHLLQGLMHSLEHVVLPRLLMLSGADFHQAALQMGLFHGMALPLLYLPGIVTGALASLGGPALAARQGKRRRSLMRRLVLWAFLTGGGCSVMLFICSDFIGEKLYHQAALGPILRILSPCAALFSLIHIFSAMLTGLGKQRLMFRRQLICSIFSLLLTFIFTPLWGLRGACFALVSGSLILCAGTGLCLLHQGHSALGPRGQSPLVTGTAWPQRRRRFPERQTARSSPRRD